MALPDKVKELRQKRGWNQATLAQKSGITQATISRIESGKISQPKMGRLQKLADALGTTIDYLAGNSIQRSIAMSNLGRLWLHIPVGLVAVVLYWLSPIAGAGFTFIFWRYEKNEDRYIKDQAWKDYAGFLWGMALGGLAWAIIYLWV